MADENRPAHVRVDALLLGLLALFVYWLAYNGRFMFFNYHLHLSSANYRRR